MYDTTYKITPNKSLTSEGFLICENAVIASIAPRTYLAEEVAEVKPNKNGQVQLVRNEGVLFSPETIAGFEGKPVTLDHPKENWVDTENWKNVTVGTVSHVRRGEGAQSGCLVADLIIFNKDAIDAVLTNQATELSCGFSSHVIDKGGGVGFEDSFSGNHVALVQKGKGGATCRLADSKFNLNGDKKMFGKKADEDLTAQLLEQIKALTERVAQLEKGAEAKAEEKEIEKTVTETEVKPIEEKKDEAPVEVEIKKEEPVEGKEVLPGFDQEKLKAIIAQALTDALTAKEDECKKKYDSETIKACADIAPNVNKDDPNLVMSAISEFAKTPEGAEFVKGFGEIKADRATVILESCANYKRTLAKTKTTELKADSVQKSKSFTEMARDLWKK